MHTTFSSILRAGAVFSLLLSASSMAAAEFPLKDGDTWVMAGDSITAQHLHSNYYEAYCFARYPKLTFRFRNSGVGGDTIPKVMARFDWDVAAWKPTVVSVELGMNDQGGFPVDKFIENMGQLDRKIRTAGAGERYVLHANDAPLATLTAKELAAGVNLTSFGTGPIAAQGKAVLSAVKAKEELVNQWRGQSKAATAAGSAPEAEAKLGELTKKVEEADAKIRDAAKPKKLHFELIAAN